MHCRIGVKVSAAASRDAIRGWLGEALKVSVTAAPERGRANDAVEALLAQALGVPRTAVEVVAGHTQPRKQVRIEGLDAAAVRTRLQTIG